MSKLTILSVLSKIFAHTTWGIANLYRATKNVSKNVVNSFKSDCKYNVEIFKDSEQMDVKHNLSHQQLLQVINTLSVFKNLSLIVYTSDGKGEPVVIDI